MPSLVYDWHSDRPVRSLFLEDPHNKLTPESYLKATFFPARLSELLMRHDAVCLRLYGENMFIPLLLKALGVRTLLELLEQGALKFHLEREHVTYSVNDLPGVHPLQSGSFTSTVHSDPEASVEQGTRGLLRPPEPATLRRLKKSLAEAYLHPGETHAPTAVRLAHDGYGRGRFASLGVSPEHELGRMPLADRKRLCTIATEMHRLAVVAALHAETLDEPIVRKLFDESVAHLTRAGRIAQSNARIFEIENLPSLQTAFALGLLPVEKIAQMRTARDAVRFRRWLHETTDNVDASEIGRAYLDAVSRPIGFFQRFSGRLGKTIAVSALSGAVGGAFAGLEAAAFAAGAAGLLGGAPDLALDLVDEFLLDRVTRGWTPRHYIERSLRPALKGRTR